MDGLKRTSVCVCVKVLVLALGVVLCVLNCTVALVDKCTSVYVLWCVCVCVRGVDIMFLLVLPHV